MPTEISGLGITTGSIDLTTPLATADGGTGSSTISPYQMVLGTAVLYSSFNAAALGGTALTFHEFQNIPSWVKRITVMLNGVSMNGSNLPMIQLGDSGGIETTGYIGCAIETYGTNTLTSANQSSSGFYMQLGMAPSLNLGGKVTLNLTGNNAWVLSGHIYRESGADIVTTIGNKTLTGTLDRLRLTTNSADTFDAGSVNIMYEGY